MTRVLGIGQWFHYQDEQTLERSVRHMRALGLRHLRTGVSWADFHRPDGAAWTRRLLDAVSEFDVLLSVWHTPPSRAEAPLCNAPPARLEDYGDFIAQLIDEYGDSFNDLELWNEPNNWRKWNFRRFDPDWSKFARMVGYAARQAARRGRRTVLGGMIPVDASWLQLIESHGGLDDVDVVGIHGFPGMWWAEAPCWDWHSHWRGWADKVEQIAAVADGRPIWITETGLATWDLKAGRLGRECEQAQRLCDAAAAPVQRVYWYSLLDLDPQRSAIEGYHVDENEYHLGLIDWEDRPKPASETMRQLLAPRHARGRRAVGAGQ